MNNFALPILVVIFHFSEFTSPFFFRLAWLSHVRSSYFIFVEIFSQLQHFLHYDSSHFGCARQTERRKLPACCSNHGRLSSEAKSDVIRVDLYPLYLS
jgi:hypothetical protein